VQVLALSDHDTLAGVRELMAPGKAALPLELLPAVEINSVAMGIPQLWKASFTSSAWAWTSTTTSSKARSNASAAFA